MEIEKILDLEGIKLLDTNVFCSEHDLSFQLHCCRNISDIPLEAIKEEAICARKGIEYILRKDVYSIFEVADEKEALLARLNKSLKSLSRNSYNNHAAARRKKSFISLDNSTEYQPENNSLNCLNSLRKDLTELIKAIKGKNIRKTFSDKENELYNNFLAYFLYVCEKYGLKKDYTKFGEFLKNRKSSELHTDEKLASTQFALAFTRIRPPILISSDSDIKKMISHYYEYGKHRREFGVPKLPFSVMLFSDFNEGRGFEMQRVYRK